MPEKNPADKDFKALPGKEAGEEGEEDVEFKEERKKAIEEAAKGEQKKFGGGGNIQTKREQKSSSMEKQWEKGASYNECPPPDPEGGEGRGGSGRGGRGGRGGGRGGREEGGGGRGRGGRGGRGGGRGRRGGEEEEVLEGQALPSKPVSLFDFLADQIPSKTASVGSKSNNNGDDEETKRRIAQAKAESLR